MSRTALITGASSGIGRATAIDLVARGHRVIGTSRHPEQVPDDQRVDGVEYVTLELSDPASVSDLGDLLAGVDILVNNAGESQSGPLEDLPEEVVRRIFETNVFGAIRLTQLALPGMRAREYGRVVMIGSMLASFPLAYRSSYVASKAAIKGFATAARYEMAPFGVWLTTVEPGYVHTGINKRRTNYLADDSAHRSRLETLLAAVDRNAVRGIPAERVSRAIVTAIEAERPLPFYAVGSHAPLLLGLRRIITRATAERLIQRRHDITPAKP